MYCTIFSIFVLLKKQQKKAKRGNLFVIGNTTCNQRDVLSPPFDSMPFIHEIK